MLKSYEAIYERGQIKWLKEEPTVGTAHIIVTILEDNPSGINGGYLLCPSQAREKF